MQAKNQTCIVEVANLIAGYRANIVNFFDALQAVEAATIPAATIPIVTSGTTITAPGVFLGPEIIGGLGEEISGNDLAGLYLLLATEYTYQGTYKCVPNLQIPANQNYYPVSIGFPVRIFRLDTDLPISVYLQNVSGDVFYLDYQFTPFKMKKISGGLAFDTIYVTNQNNVPATLFLFAMG